MFAAFEKIDGLCIRRSWYVFDILIKFYGRIADFKLLLVRNGLDWLENFYIKQTFIFLDSLQDIYKSHVIFI